MNNREKNKRLKTIDTKSNLMKFNYLFSFDCKPQYLCEIRIHCGNKDWLLEKKSGAGDGQGKGSVDGDGEGNGDSYTSLYLPDEINSYKIIEK